MSGGYAAQISGKTPACVAILVDQSASMAERLGDIGGNSKADAAATAVNRLLKVLATTSTKVMGEGPRPYFDVAVLGYAGRDRVTCCLPGSGSGSELVSIAVLGNKPVRVEPRTKMMRDDRGGQVQTTLKVPVWIDPVADGGTPMLHAMQAVYPVIDVWARGHPESYPPIVINITDGEPNQDPTEAARRLEHVSTNDGSALLYNVHLSGAARMQIRFPASTASLPDRFARLLFDISSALPDKVSQELSKDYPIDPGARGFIFNADAALLVKFLEVGTRIEQKPDGWDR